MVAITCDPSERVLGVQLQRRPTPLVQGRSGACMEGRYGSLFRSIILALPIGTVCWPGAVLAQTTRSPREVEALPDDTAKVFSLADQCFAYRRKDVDSALMFGERALRLARSLKFPKGEAQALNDLAIIHIDRSAYADADSALRRALSIRRSLGDRAGVGAIHNKLGNLYQSQLRLEEALEQNQQALSIFNTLGDRSKEALILSNIAVINFNMRQYDQALEYHRAAADMHRSSGDSTGLATSLGNMANVFLSLGDTVQALDVFEQAGSYFKRHGMLREFAVQANNEAGVRATRGEASRAMMLYSEALRIREAGNDRKATASSFAGLSDVHLFLGRTTDARRMASKALALASAVGATNEMMQAHRLLARIHARLGHADSTLMHHERYAALQDSVFSTDMGKRIADLQARIGLQQKEHELQEQRAVISEKGLEIAELGRKAERRNFLLALALGGIGALILGALAVLQVQRRRASAQRAAAVIAEREQGLKAIVQGTDAERKRIAGELHDGVGQLLTGLKYRIEMLAGSDPRLADTLALADEAGREVRDIAHRMMPRSLEGSGLVPALSDMLNKALDVPGVHKHFEHHGMEQRLPSELETGIYRVAQELLNNIIKHAKATRVDIQLLRTKGVVVLIVEDDGVGMGPAPSKGGLGLRNLHDRARILQGTLEFTGQEGRGTVATLRVPIQEKAAA